MFQKRSRLESIQLILLGILIGLMAAGIILIVAAPPRGIAVSLAPMPTRQPIVVHVDGAVFSPGVYSLLPGSRVLDAIEAAGGLIETANSQSINMARLLQDGEQIYVSDFVLSQSDDQQPSLDNQDTPQITIESVIYPININTAQAIDLETLPGIGPQKALDIIAYRNRNGPFEQIDDIIKINGIGEGTFAQIQELITVHP